VAVAVAGTDTASMAATAAAPVRPAFEMSAILFLEIKVLAPIQDGG
jgi:hypothetical protein